MPPFSRHTSLMLKTFLAFSLVLLLAAARAMSSAAMPDAADQTSWPEVALPAALDVYKRQGWRRPRAARWY